MAAAEKVDLTRRYSVEEYFALTEVSDGKYEYVEGKLIDVRAEAEAMAGGTFEHSLVIMNCGTTLKKALQDKPCVVLDSNMRVQITRKQKYRYPDVTVICKPPQFVNAKQQRSTLTNPTLLLEVVSNSSVTKDWLIKRNEYLEIDGLREYVLVSLESYRVDHYYRHDDGTWQFAYADGLDAVAKLRSIDVTLKLSDVYAGFTLPAPDAEVTTDEPGR